MLLELPKTQKFDRRVLPEGFEVHLAEVKDIPQILPLAREFYSDTQFAYFGVEFSEANAEKYLTMLFEHNLAPAVLAFVNGQVVGWITWSYDCSFFKRPIAVLNTIFVTKKYKRSSVGRFLLSTAMELSREDQACAFYAPVNSGTQNVRSLENMLSKMSFVRSGYIMSRSL